MCPSTSSAESSGGRAYSGPERRRNRVYVTDHTEYHCRDGVCVAVRDRSSGELMVEHGAIGRHLGGSVRFNDFGGIADVHDPDDPKVGEQLCFASGEIDDPENILTSALDSIVRPDKEIVERYPVLVAPRMRSRERVA